MVLILLCFILVHHKILLDKLIEQPEYLVEAKELMEENNIDINNVICHAPYIINLANNLDEHETMNLAVKNF